MSEASAARSAEEAREERIRLGTQQIRHSFRQAFGDKHFADLMIAGKNFYQPQVENQYQQSLRQLQAALLRTGMSDSTAAKTREQEAKDLFKQASMDVENRIQGVANQRRQDIAQAESVAVGQLQASADPAAAAAQTSNLIGTNSKTPGWQPLGQVFTDFTAGLATQGDLERQGRNRYNFGVANWGDNLRRYVQNIGG